MWRSSVASQSSHCLLSFFPPRLCPPSPSHRALPHRPRSAHYGDCRKLAQTTSIQERPLYAIIMSLVPVEEVLYSARAHAKRTERDVSAAIERVVVAGNGHSGSQACAAADDAVRQSISELRALKRRLAEAQRADDEHLHACRRRIERSEPPTLDELLIDFLPRYGFIRSAAAVAADAAGGAMAVASAPRSVEERQRLLAALDERDPQPVLEWCTVHRARLKKLASPLECLLHVRVFATHAQTGGVVDAVRYARAHLAPLATEHPELVKGALGALACPSSKAPHASSPRHSLFDDARWRDAANAFDVAHRKITASPATPVLLQTLWAALACLRTPSCRGPAASGGQPEGNKATLPTVTSPEADPLAMALVMDPLTQVTERARSLSRRLLERSLTGNGGAGSDEPAEASAAASTAPSAAALAAASRTLEEQLQSLRDVTERSIELQEHARRIGMVWPAPSSADAAPVAVQTLLTARAAAAAAAAAAACATASAAASATSATAIADGGHPSPVEEPVADAALLPGCACPVCCEPFASLSGGAPTVERAYSTLVCRLSGAVMDDSNPPLVLPGGQVCSRKALAALAESGALVDTCTGERLALESLRRAYFL